MRAVDVIAKKRDGQALTREEIEFFVQGFTRGEIADYQASAWAMAVYLRGMNDDETTALTLAMANSGQTLDLSRVAPLVLDKHSSGGVGDKTTLVVGPVIAAVGLPFGKMSGRGLGFSGGTLDKLESIPGFRSDLNTSEFVNQLKRIGIVVSGQTHDLAPADGKLYGLRDVTATVSSLPLIASSIMSKKVAAGAHVILLDVKVGQGAFMKTEQEAIALAELMVKIGRLSGRRIGAVISDMNQPLGNAVGNSLEVIEAIETLKGHGPDDFAEHCQVVSSQLLLLANAAPDEAKAKEQVREVLQTGQAIAKFRDWISAQGGNPRVVDDYSMLPRSPNVEAVQSPHEAFIGGINAEQVGLTVVDLGGGRAKKEDAIDRSVGVVFAHKVGDRVRAGETLFTLHASDRASAEAAKNRLLQAYTFSDKTPETPPLIHQVVR